jgi:hypothetical protein
VHRVVPQPLKGPGQPRVLGVRLTRFDPAQRPAGPDAEFGWDREEAGVVVVLSNAGGTLGGVVGGSCRVYLDLRRGPAGWEVMFKGYRST